MADTEKPPSPVSPLKANEGRPESPTTARELEFDSDQERPLSSKGDRRFETAPNPPPKDETPPPKPPRPLSAKEQAENTLKEAFPTVEPSVVKAILAASGGQVEPAFNALLGMTDPEAAEALQREREPAPPPKPPRPQRQGSGAPQTQLDADEEYARQLQHHYSNAAQAQAPGGRYNEHLQGSRQGRPGSNPNPDDVPWRSFFDDDLPEIKDNIKKGFLETQTTVNKWLTNFKNKIDGVEDDEFAGQPARQAQTYGGGRPYGRTSSDGVRRSADMQRYDADPQVIGDDFSKLDLKDGEAPPRTSSRPLANPNLFKPSSLARKSSSPGSGRKVSFQAGPPEEIRDMYSGSPKPTSATQTPAAAAKSSKWQPLSSVDPAPMTENDPFSLGDSDDEKDAKPIQLQDEDEDAQVKKATDEAMGDSIADAKGETKK